MTDWDESRPSWLGRLWRWLKYKFEKKPQRIFVRDYYTKQEFEIEPGGEEGWRNSK